MSQQPDRPWRSIGECAGSRTESPFPYGSVDDDLPDAEATELAAEFPDLTSSPSAQRLPRGKRRLVLTSADVGRADLSAAWSRALAAVTDPDYLERTLAFVRSVRPRQSSQVPVAIAAAHDRLTVDDLDVLVEAAELADGAFLPPHTDAAGKLISCVLALPTSRPWPAGWGGQTVVLRDRRERANWSNVLGDPADFDVEAEVPVRWNRLFWFVKTSMSWHAVEAATPPAPHARRSFNVSVVVSPAGQERTGLGEALRAVEAAERVA